MASARMNYQEMTAEERTREINRRQIICQEKMMKSLRKELRKRPPQGRKHILVMMCGEEKSLFYTMKDLRNHLGNSLWSDPRIYAYVREVSEKFVI